MTTRQALIHKRAKDLSKRYRRTEWEIVEVLQEVQETKLYLVLELRSLFDYAVEILELDDAVAYSFINVARKARNFPQLQRALKDQKLSVTKAARIAATLAPDNAKGLVEFAVTHSKREIEREIARINPKAAGKNSVKQLSEDYVQVTITMRRSAHEKMKRAEDIHGLSAGETADRVYGEHLERNDPVLKAKRALGRKALREESATAPSELCPGRVGRLKSAEQHAVNARDEGQCTIIDSRGKRCPERRWLDIHHIIERSRGGTNDPANLTTLCRVHHQAHHAGPGG